MVVVVVCVCVCVGGVGLEFNLSERKHDLVHWSTWIMANRNIDMFDCKLFWVGDNKEYENQ